MRHSTSGWFKLTAVCSAGCLVTLVLAQGCSADGGAENLDPTAEEAKTEGTHLPAPSGGGGGGDAGKPKDAGGDVAKDAGPPPPVPGTPCSKIDDIFKKKCGVCGEQSAICLATGEGGAGAWSDYSLCAGELAGGCVPGTTVTEACGNCGTLTKTCSAFCAWSTSACMGQPASSCTPGGVEFSTAGCTVASTYRQRSCKNDCTWNPFSAGCSAPPTTVNIPPTAGTVTNTIVELTSAQLIGRMTGTCPPSTPSISTTYLTPYRYLTVHNPHAKAATVSIYNSQLTGGPIYKTLLVAYAGTTVPADDTQRKACLKGVATSGTVALTGNSSFASLDATRVVPIAAGQSVLVFVGSYYNYDTANPANSTGAVMLNVRTETLE